MPFEPVQILLVDDQEGNLLALEALLAAEGRRVRTARSGAEALELLLVEDVALALLDVQMPEMDGFQLAELMRGTERTRRVPIIFLTAGATDAPRRFRGYGLGAVDFIFKPIDNEVLRSKVDVFVDLARQRQELVHAALEREELLQSKIAAEHRYRVLFESAAAGIAVWDGHGGLVDCNRPYEHLTGCTMEELRALAWRDLIHPDDRPANEHLLEELRCGRLAHCRLEHRLVRKDGTEVWVENAFSAVPVADGQTGHLAVVTDVTAKRRAAEELQRSMQAAHEASQAKDQLLAVLSHELRTPLTPVLTLAQMLEEDPDLDARHQQIVQTIRRNVELEARLIDDLLDLTRITRNKLELQIALVDVHERVEHVLEMCAEEIQLKQLVVEKRLQATRRHVLADPTRLQQILWNLVKNAVKFTPVRGRIWLRTEDAAAERLLVEVGDDGVGIAPGLLPRLFDAFEQGGRDVTRQFGGLGLGLAISKALVELHGGTIIGASEGVGRGATFTVALPAATAAAARPTVVEPPLSREVPCRILLVEDHGDTRRALAALLVKMGCDVRVADSLAEARRQVEGFHPKLLISDIGLPDGSGMELMRELQISHGVCGIALSGYGMEEDRRSSAAAGFAIHLVKPVPVRRLRQAVEQLLAPRRGSAVEAAAGLAYEASGSPNLP
jgi:PAS domain S-box-containing protein